MERIATHDPSVKIMSPESGEVEVGCCNEPWRIEFGIGRDIDGADIIRITFNAPRMTEKSVVLEWIKTIEYAVSCFPNLKQIELHTRRVPSTDISTFLHTSVFELAQVLHRKKRISLILSSTTAEVHASMQYQLRPPSRRSQNSNTKSKTQTSEIIDKTNHSTQKQSNTTMHRVKQEADIKPAWKASGDADRQHVFCY